MLKTIIQNFILESGLLLLELPLFYETFGQPLGTAPVVLVNHALTGNSTVTGNNGWWNKLIGENKTIDTAIYTLIAFNIPGNGYDGSTENLIENYKAYTVKDIAALFWNGLENIGVENLFAVVGGSLGGGIAWEMAALKPNKIENLIPIASDWKATDWVIANTMIQDAILNNSSQPIHDARLHAMLLYRSPESLNMKFGRQKNEANTQFQIESWLEHHGEKLQNRFQLSAYKLMNHLLKTIDITRNRIDFLSVAGTIQSNIHLVAVDSDYFFTANEDRETYKNLKEVKTNVFYYEIKSIHGHDAFLMEYDQLNSILKPLFTKTNKKA